MRKLAIPELLKQEFATVEAVWNSAAETRRVDALILSWTKYEKQLRRLFCFLIYQHPKINAEQVKKVIDILAENRYLYPHTFIDGIKKLGVASVPDLLAGRYQELSPEITRIREYRNKLIHGQITGQSIKSERLESDVILIVDWITTLANAAQTKFGYDGLRRNTFLNAKKTSGIAVAKYPFNSVAELRNWLNTLTQKPNKKPS